MTVTRIATSCGSVIDLLQKLIDRNAKTRLVICCTKAEFLLQTSWSIRSQCKDSQVTAADDLLTKTIGLLANSSKIQLVFCPSLESLRAYLSAHQLNSTTSHELQSEKQRSDRLFVILDMVALHSTTTEFSAQGLSRSFATAAEFAAGASTDLMIVECNDSVDSSNLNRGAAIWNIQVPLLNGSVRIRGEQDKWGGRGVAVKDVAQRWFELGPELRP
ncbi:Uncharacterized protein PECH_006516 [Penicillium ucsense]|uniref:Uncharacterized protein n=1 Tax=Penicillium ucsense TaxID=2839758 RepID=A0A8J8WHY2_9EURO|nr:Uncharacterized protein PECM_002882 [Penicillium ucsense]KAF7735612.1 Uncharacterized protein PECH_006516 [Penicillium ucsense]